MNKQYARDGTGRITSDYEPTKEEIQVCRDAICREFGNTGTDGYYVRILKAIQAAQREPVTEGEVARVCHFLRLNNLLSNTEAADLLERTEATRLAAEGRLKVALDERFDLFKRNQLLETQLAAARERGEKLENELTHTQGIVSRLQGQRSRLYKKLRDIKDVVDAAQALMAWCVKNVNKWHFHEYDALHRAIAVYQSSKENSNG